MRLMKWVKEYARHHSPVLAYFGDENRYDNENAYEGGWERFGM